MDDNETKKSSHSIAVAKYNAKNYKTFSVNMRPDEYDKLVLVSGNCGMGKSRLLINLINKLNEDEIAEIMKREDLD